MPPPSAIGILAAIVCGLYLAHGAPIDPRTRDARPDVGPHVVAADPDGQVVGIGSKRRAGRATDPTEVTSLPGYDRELPSRHFAGYITVDPSHGRHLYYYFVTSQGEPAADPVVLWLNGGPGCTSMMGFMSEIGPFEFEYSDNVTRIVGLNPYAWTRVASVIFLDSPAGVGLSYSETPEDYNANDTRTAHDSNIFLRMFFERYSQFQRNKFYIAGESFAGVYVPMLTREVVQGNEEGQKPFLNLKGYLDGNGCTDPEFDFNAVPSFAVGMSMISRAEFDKMNAACGGNMYKGRMQSQECATLINQFFDEVYKDINVYDILLPCQRGPPQNGVAESRSTFPRSKLQSGLHQLAMEGSIQWPLGPVLGVGRVHNWHSLFDIIEPPCTDYWTIETWYADENVRKAIHAQPASVAGVFKLCTNRINYTHNVPSMIPIHFNLTQHYGLPALIYSGDHDMSVPHTGSEAWVYSLKLPLKRKWQPWLDEDDQVAGYTVEFKNLVYATVKGSGHEVPQYKPKQGFLMFSRFLNNQSVHKNDLQ